MFTLFNLFAFRADRVRNPDTLVGVVRTRASGAEPRMPFARADYDALRRETSVFTDVAGRLPDIDSRIDGRMMGGMLVTGNFFEVVGVTAARGRVLTPADDERFAPRPVMVLSHRGWSRLFGEDPAVVGREVLVNGSPVRIVGVAPEGFRGLSIAVPDYWAPLSLLAQFRPIHAGREDRVGFDIVGRLRPGLSPAAALAALGPWAAERTGGTLAADGRRPAIVLEPRQGTLPEWGEMLMVVTPLFFAFGLILLIGCANVANLLLARAVSRQREIGIRLSLGASRQRILRQLLTESLWLALAAAACGLVLSRVVLETTVRVVMATMAPELSENFQLSVPALDWRVFAFLAVGAVAATAFFGLVPALQATRVDLLRTIRGELTKDAGPGRARHALIAVQVTASALLLICAAVFLRSTLRSAAADPGFRTSDTVFVDVVNEPTRTAMVDAVRAEALVASTAAMRPDLMGRPREAFAHAASAGRPDVSAVAYRFVSPEYFSVLDIPVRRGRPFGPDEAASGAAVVVIAETTARRLWPDGEAVGQILHLEPDPNSETRRRDEAPLPSRTFTVIGVVRDVPGFRLAGFDEAGVYLPTSPASADTSLILRVQGDPELARRALLTRLTALDPNMGVVVTMRTLAGLEAYFLKLAFWLAFVLGTLALVLTLSGLFGVLSYLVEQRRKEIAVRMALGATTRTVAATVLGQSLRPVVLGLGAGAGLASAVAILLLATPLAASIGNVVRVFDPLAYAASLGAIVVACLAAAAIPAFRAARIDPMTTLRQD